MTFADHYSHFGVYYRESYLAAAGLVEGGGELHVFQESNSVIPLILRPLPEGCSGGWDAISPYDYSGPLLNGESAQSVWQALNSWAHERGIVTAFFRFHPFHGHAEEWRGLEGFELVHSADNIVVELVDRDTIASRFKPQVERDLKVAHRARLAFALDPISTQRLDAFVPLYWASMDRLGADSYYRFPRAFFDALADGLHDAAMVASITLDGDLAASALVFLEDTTAFYYLACSSDAGRKACAMNMLVAECTFRLEQMGFERFHLGGGPPSLRHFKERFGPDRVPYFVGRAIFDSQRYTDLAGGLSTDYFPVYRCPSRRPSSPVCAP